MKRFSGCFIALFLAVFAFAAVSCMSDGGTISTDGTGEKEGTGDIVVNPVIDTKPFEEEIEGLKKELEDKNEAIAKSIEEASKKYQEALEQLKAEQAADATAQEKIDEQSAKTSAALAKYTAAQADLTAAKAAAETAKTNFDNVKAAKEAEELTKSNVQKIDITIQRAGTWEQSGTKKNEIPFIPNGFFKLKFCSDKNCTDTIDYTISAQPSKSDQTVNTLINVGGTLEWSVPIAERQLPSSHTSYWQLCYTGGDFDLGGLYMKIDDKPAYNLLSSGRVIPKDKCLNFGKDDLAFAVYTNTQGADDDATDSSIIMKVPCADNACAQALNKYESYWKASNPNETLRADSTTGNAEGPHMEIKSNEVALFLDDRWNNYDENDDEAFFFYLDGTGVNTNNATFSLEILGEDHWEFNYVVAMLYQPADSSWLRDATPMKKIGFITEGDYGISTDSGEGDGIAKVDMVGLDFTVSEDFKEITLTRESKEGTQKHEDNNISEKILTSDRRPKGDAYVVSVVAEAQDAYGLCGANSAKLVTDSLKACEDAAQKLKNSELQKDFSDSSINILTCNPLEKYYLAQTLILECQALALGVETTLYTDAATKLKEGTECSARRGYRRWRPTCATKLKEGTECSAAAENPAGTKATEATTLIDGYTKCEEQAPATVQ